MDEKSDIPLKCLSYFYAEIKSMILRKSTKRNFLSIFARLRLNQAPGKEIEAGLFCRQKKIFTISLLLLVFSHGFCQEKATKNPVNGTINGHPAWIMQGNIYEVNVRQYTEVQFKYILPATTMKIAGTTQTTALFPVRGMVPLQCLRKQSPTEFP
jgi:hypothetical protein